MEGILFANERMVPWWADLSQEPFVVLVVHVWRYSNMPYAQLQAMVQQLFLS